MVTCRSAGDTVTPFGWPAYLLGFQSYWFKLRLVVVGGPKATRLIALQAFVGIVRVHYLVHQRGFGVCRLASSPAHFGPFAAAPQLLVALILMSTPAGRLNLLSASMVLAVACTISMSRLWVRISNC